MGLKITNNAFGTLAASINDSVTSITVASGQGARFPTLGAGDYFYATLINISNEFEIVQCTARIGDVLTVTRAQDGTTARAYTVGDRLEIRPVAAIFDGKQDTLPAATTGEVLVYSGTAWVAGAAPGFDTGTRLGFQQTSAPTGWTKDTTAGLNDSIMRIVTGSASSGGSTGFSAAAIGATTLSTAQIPSHAHTAKSQGTLNITGGSGFGNNISSQSAATSVAGGGGSHDHSFPAIKYYDFIIAQKS